MTRSGLICRGDVLRLTEPRSEIKALPKKSNVRNRHLTRKTVSATALFTMTEIPLSLARTSLNMTSAMRESLRATVDVP